MKNLCILCANKIGRLYAIVALLFACAGAWTCLPAQVTERPISGGPIRIESGLLAGKLLASGVKAWFGVPYAAAPVRELRWKEPQPVKPWQGVYTADRFPPMCPQGTRNSDTNHYSGEEPVSEDCLYLNIWSAPDAQPSSRLPVFLYIYGGNFTGGSASMQIYGGEGLAKKGAVYVAMNYRLGFLGFLAHPELLAESQHHTSGNYGYMDQVAALRWINRNIAAFGGDPSNVTVMGQSSGAMAVNNLQASPLAKGLIHKAVGFSGGTVYGYGANEVPMDAALKEGKQIQEQLKAGSINDMRKLSWERITAAANAINLRSHTVMYDGYFLPKKTKEIFAAGEQSDIPTLVGATRNDVGTTNEFSFVTELRDYRWAADKLFGPRASEFLQVYSASTDAEALAQAKVISESSGMNLSASSWAKAQAMTGKAPSYVYLFTKIHPYTPGWNAGPLTAYHTGDVPYFLDILESLNQYNHTRDWTAYDRKLASDMADALIAFAKTGNPNTPSVKWPRFTVANPQKLEFGDQVRPLAINARGRDLMEESISSAQVAGTRPPWQPSGTTGVGNVQPGPGGGPGGATGSAMAPSQQPGTAQTPATPPSAQQGQRAAGSVSPEIGADKRVTFRLRDPGAREVIVVFGGSSGGPGPMPMTKDSQGVWSVTTPEPMPPDLYSYSFQVDGTKFPDPSNLQNTWAASPSGSQAATSALYVPGVPWTDVDGPHGAVAKHVYQSPIIGGPETYYVYTPPNYDFKRKAAYPVLVALHGLGNNAQDWITQAGANYTLDALITAGKAMPMILVSPAAYGQGQRANAAAGFPSFTKALLEEILPRVEKEYNASDKASERAITGLSMGAAQSLLLLNRLDKFEWIGSFSPGFDMYSSQWSGGGGGGAGAPQAQGAGGRGAAGNAQQGGRGAQPAPGAGGRGSGAITQRALLEASVLEATFPKLDASSNSQIKLLYLTCGTADDHLNMTRQFKAFLETRKVKITNYSEPEGVQHVFSFWRQQLAAFAQLLFKPAAH